MAEVLAKADKYINGEEDLLSKRENSSARRRIAGARKNENEALGDEEIGISPHEGTEKTESGLQRDEAMSGNSWAHLSPSCSSDIHPRNSPP